MHKMCVCREMNEQNRKDLRGCVWKIQQGVWACMHQQDNGEETMKWKKIFRDGFTSKERNTLKAKEENS